jgi:uncharacterized protein (DUF1330 family)
MTYYVTVDLTISDESWIEDYLPNVTALVEKHGGKYLVRTPQVEKFEGAGGNPDIYVLIEFASKDGAASFYNDPDYKPYRDARHAGASGNMYLFAGEDIAAG